MASGGRRPMLARVLAACVLASALAGQTHAMDVESVIALPVEPYVIPVPNHTYEFPRYGSLSVLTQRNDNNRSGASHWPGINQHSRFRKLGEFFVDGVVTAQPLYAHSALVRNLRQPVLIVANSKNEVWAFPPVEGAAPFWRASLGPPLISVEAPSGGANCDTRPNAAWPQQGGPGLIGIEATPVIDVANNQVLAGFKILNGHQRLAAIDLNDGRVRSVQVPAPSPAANPDWHKLHRNRASLLLADGVVYLAFSALCEGTHQKNHGSIVAFDAKTLAHVGTFEVTDHTMDGGGIWQASTGPAADTRGNLYFITGNRRLKGPCLVGFDDGSPPDAPNISNSVVRLKAERRTASGRPPGPGEAYTLNMSVADTFTPYRKLLGDCSDLDLGSSGALLIPASRYIVAGGKEGIIYVLDRSDLGGFEHAGPPWTFSGVSPVFASGFRNSVPDDPNRDRVKQKFQVGFNQYDRDYPVHDLMRWPHIHGTPVFARFGPDLAFIFVWPEKDRIKRFRWLGDRLEPVSTRGEPPAPFFFDDRRNGMPGGMLSVNIDPRGPGLGVVLASAKICDGTRPPAAREPGYPRCDEDQNRGVLRAYDPFTMQETWSNKGENYWYAKFVPPTVAAGRIFLPTASGKVIIYGP
jgi:outer membrane protein assembly factor BamB